MVHCFPTDMQAGADTNQVSLCLCTLYSFHYSICLFLYQNQRILSTMTLWLILMFCRANPSILFFFFKNDLAIVGSLYFHQNFKKLNIIPTLSLSPHHLTESAVTKVSEAIPIVKSTGQFLVFILFDLFTALAITVYSFLHEILSSLSCYNITLLGFFTHTLLAFLLLY